MSRVSKRALQLENLKLRILELQNVINETIERNSPTPNVFVIKFEITLIKSYINKIKTNTQKKRHTNK